MVLALYFHISVFTSLHVVVDLWTIFFVLGVFENLSQFHILVITGIFAIDFNILIFYCSSVLHRKLVYSINVGSDVGMKGVVFCSLSIFSAHIAVINSFWGKFMPKFYWRLTVLHDVPKHCLTCLESHQHEYNP